jgi:hypothetical protein
MRSMKSTAAVCTIFFATLIAAQSQPAAEVPRLVRYSGALINAAGKSLTGVVGVTFALYDEEHGGNTVWMETQNVQCDPSGHYTATLGATRNEGIPADVFASAQGRWLGVQPEGEPEQPRVLLLSVPYALKAVDAETLGGLPASAYVLAPVASPGSPHAAAAKALDIKPSVTGTGTANYIAYWTSSTALGSSAIYQSNTNLGIGTTSPGAKLEVDTTGVTAIAGYATSTSNNGDIGVFGQSAGALGAGVSGQNSVGTGVIGISTSTSGSANGVSGETSSASGSGVWGLNNATSGQAIGVTGQTDSAGGAGVVGQNFATTGGNGVNGISNATGGLAAGVSGTSASVAGSGVYGSATATSGNANGIFGQTASPAGSGVVGQAAASGSGSGVMGTTSSPSGTGVYGSNTAATGYAFGVQGVTASTSGVGVQGSSPNVAVAGFTQTCSTSCTLVKGIAGQFVTTAGGTILQGLNGSTQVFIVDAKGDGHFAGNLTVTGKLTKGSGSFKIDHPLDPAHKYLSHSFVESPDMMNVYNGVIRLNAKGEAWVVLPDYFEALNGDYRYQLTAMGAPSPRLYVAREVSANRFKIAGGRPNGRVSWQVTGIRHDAYANANRIPVTEDKPSDEQGTYLHPDVFTAGRVAQ